jgi:hypothetical protein
MFLLVDSIKPKFCINCKHFVKPPDGMSNEYAKCSIFIGETQKFLVDGVHRQSDYKYCSTARQFEDLCGKNATKYKKRYILKKTKINSTTVDVDM